MSIFQETWLLALCFTLLLLVVIGAVVIVYIKRRQSKQRKSHNSNGTAIANAQQCLISKEAVWLRERSNFEGSTEPRIEILSCHQNLLRGGSTISTMAMEAEYTLPQQTSSMNPIPEENPLRIQPEPYASSAIYTELNYQDHTDAEDSCLKCAVSPGSYDNSMVRSYGESNQYSNEECSTCCRSSSSTLTKDYSEMTKCNDDEQMSIEDCPSCKTNHSRSSSHHEAKEEWAMAEVEYDYPQWHWLGRENSFRHQSEDMRYATQDQGLRYSNRPGQSINFTFQPNLDLSYSTQPSLEVGYSAQQDLSYNGKQDMGYCRKQDTGYSEKRDNSYSARPSQDTGYSSQSGQDMRFSTAGRSEQNCRMNLCDILPPPPYERESPYREMNAFTNHSGTSGCSSHTYRS